jgi:protein LTV1
MGRKKAFIDKKQAVTYSLVHRSTEDHSDTEVGDRILVANEQLGQPNEAPRDPRLLYQHFFGGAEDSDSQPLAEDRRRENLEYGFPDDGYDYLRHLRVIGRGQASMEQHVSKYGGDAAGPSTPAPSTPSTAPAAAAVLAFQGEPSQSVFLKAPRRVAPAADVKLVDARQLHVLTVDAASSSSSGPLSAPGGVAVEKTIAGKVASEIAEIEQLMAAAEAITDDEDAGEEGLGDLLDDFVVTAAAEEGGPVQPLFQPAEQQQQQQRLSPLLSEGSSRTAASAAAAGHSSSSGRRDMVPTAAFDTLNEQFDHLLEAYDSDDMGDLEDDRRAAGKASLDDFQDQLGEYLGVHEQDSLARQGAGASSSGRGQKLGFGVIPEDEEWEDDTEGSEYTDEEEGCEGGRQGTRRPDGGDAELPGTRLGRKGANKVESLEEKDAAVISAVRARLAAVEARGGEGGEDLQMMYMPRREQWDCESVLSLRSNISYQPGKIPSEAPGQSSRGRGRGSQAGGLIKLNTKTGLPAGYGSGAAAAGGAEGLALTHKAIASMTAAAAAAAVAAAGGGGEMGSEGGSEDDDADERMTSATSMYDRPKGESAEERKARKAAVKAAQREARAAKKALKDLYAQEAVKQQRQQAAAQHATTFAIP